MTPFVDLTSQESTSEGTKIDLRRALYFCLGCINEGTGSNNSGFAAFLGPSPFSTRAAFRVRYRWSFVSFSAVGTYVPEALSACVSRVENIRHVLFWLIEWAIGSHIHVVHGQRSSPCVSLNLSSLSINPSRNSIDAQSSLSSRLGARLRVSRSSLCARELLLHVL